MLGPYFVLGLQLILLCLSLLQRFQVVVIGRLLRHPEPLQELCDAGALAGHTLFVECHKSNNVPGNKSVFVTNRASMGSKLCDGVIVTVV